MYPLLHQILIVAYVLLPVAAFVRAAAMTTQSPQRRRGTLARLLATCMSGVVLGTCVTVATAALAGGNVGLGQTARSWYFATAFLLLLRAFRWVVRQVTFRALRVRRNEAGSPVPAVSLRSLLAGAVQFAVMVALVLPFVIGALLTVRVKVAPPGDPLTVARCAYVPVTFEATDGLSVEGWWVPAKPQRRNPGDDVRDRWGRTTVLLCRGVVDDARSTLGLVWLLASDGYNVLCFDLRGTGRSGGYFTSFGDLERRDVLGALRWVKANHVEETDRILGLGLSTGGAAMIAAAIDSSGEGEEIDAVAVYGAYADFASLAEQQAARYLPPRAARTVARMIVASMSLHAGTDLSHFAPAKLVEQLWPRPVLIVHGIGDQVVPCDQGQALSAAASAPKLCCWPMADHNGALSNREAVATLRTFFATARRVPAI